MSSCKKGIEFLGYEVREGVPLRERHRSATFIVYFNEDTADINCKCQLFGFRRILCGHQIMVFLHRGTKRIPENYILKRWSKTIVRSHTKVWISYEIWFKKPEAARFKKCA